MGLRGEAAPAGALLFTRGAAGRAVRGIRRIFDRTHLPIRRRKRAGPGRAFGGVLRRRAGLRAGRAAKASLVLRGQLPG